MTDSPEEAIFWDTRYEAEDYVYGLSANDFLNNNISLFKQGSRVLSIAEGEGRNAVHLAKRHCSVTAIDFSATAKNKALNLAEKSGVSIEYKLADLYSFDMGTSDWDAIVSIFCHPPRHERPMLYRHIQSALRDDGLFLLEAYNLRQPKYGTGGPKEPALLVSLDELISSFREFEILLARDIERKVIEGTGHTGLSSVTQFIARKPMGNDVN